MHKPVFLVGMPGAGKTTIGRKLSEAMAMPFIDLDEYIEEKQGKLIRDIFSKQGEEKFRQIEAQALRQVSSIVGGAIVATGGGTPCFYDNMEFMNAAGTTVFLKAAPEIIAERLGHGREQRPLVAGKSNAEIRKFVSETLALRMKFYENAHITYSGVHWDIADLCALIRKMETLC